MKVGILGGSFNPPHIGHSQLCEYARSGAKLGKILLIPTGDHPFKRKVGISKFQRYEMTKLFAANREGFFVSDIEINREGLSYTVDTVKALRKISDEDYYFIFGSDLLFQFTWWKNFRELAKIVKFVCVPRMGIDNGGIYSEAEKLNKTFGAHITILDGVSPIEISSSQIRADVESHKAYLESNVYEYIVKNSVYAEA